METKSDYGSANVPAPTRKKQVIESLERADEAIGRLESSIATIQKSLDSSGVISPIQLEAMLKVPASERVPMAVAIDVLVSRISEAASNIRRITESLEI